MSPFVSSPGCGVRIALVRPGCVSAVFGVELLREGEKDLKVRSRLASYGLGPLAREHRGGDASSYADDSDNCL